MVGPLWRAVKLRRAVKRGVGQRETVSENVAAEQLVGVLVRVTWM